MTVVNRFIQAVAHGGLLPKPTLIVVHSAETALAAGWANSMAANWFGLASSGVTTSAHFMVDPREIIRMLSDNVVSYAVGPNANGFTLNIEQAGRAAFSRAQWTTTDGRTQIGKVGALIAELCAVHGIPPRYATDAQIRAAAKGVPGGICFHDDIHRVLGGTSHTDPTPNYPRDLLQAAWGSTNSIPEDDMPNYYDWPQRDKEALVSDIWKGLGIHPRSGVVEDKSKETTPLDQILYTAAEISKRKTDDVINALLDHPIDRSSLKRPNTTLRAILAWSDTNVDAIVAAAKARADDKSA